MRNTRAGRSRGGGKMPPTARPWPTAAGNLPNPSYHSSITEERRRNPDRGPKQGHATIRVHRLLSLIKQGRPKSRGTGESGGEWGNGGERGDEGGKGNKGEQRNAAQWGTEVERADPGPLPPQSHPKGKPQEQGSKGGQRNKGERGNKGEQGNEAQ